MSANIPPPDEADAGGGEPPDDDVLAGELVLGVLDPEGRRRAQARAESDPQFNARIERWERRFAPWLAQVAPLTVPWQLWLQICQRLGWQPPAPARAGFWSSLAVWRLATALAAVAAVALWLARPAPTPSPVAVPPVNEEAAARPVTPLTHDDGSPGWLASVDRTHGTVLMVPVPGKPDAQGRVPELWIIPAGQAPRSLGAVSIDKSHTVSVPADARMALVPGSVLAITLEPATGMPHAAPSGPIIAKGAIQS
jgi:anti-sigma-K factor RskA